MVKLLSKFIPRVAIIRKTITETHNIKTVYLEVPYDFEKPKPGQFNELYIRGAGEVPISISDITEEGLIAHTIRFVGTVTKMFIELKEGDKIGVRGPYGNGWPLSKLRDKDVLIVAGGVGLAPLRPVIREIERNRNLYGRLMILYGARTPKDLLYRHEYSRYEKIPNSKLLVTVDRGDESWTGYVGVVTKLIPKVEIEPENTIALVCGPEIMMRFTVKDLMARGLRENQVYLSLERRMRCGVGFCGHCQVGPLFVCTEGPVFSYEKIKKYFGVEQI